MIYLLLQIRKTWRWGHPKKRKKKKNGLRGLSIKICHVKHAGLFKKHKIKILLFHFILFSVTAKGVRAHMISLRTCKGVNTCIGAKSSAPTRRRTTSGSQPAMDQNQGESLKNILGRPLNGGKKRYKFFTTKKHFFKIYSVKNLNFL